MVEPALAGLDVRRGIPVSAAEEPSAVRPAEPAGSLLEQYYPPRPHLPANAGALPVRPVDAPDPPPPAPAPAPPPPPAPGGPDADTPQVGGETPRNGTPTPDAAVTEVAVTPPGSEVPAATRSETEGSTAAASPTTPGQSGDTPATVGPPAVPPGADAADLLAGLPRLLPLLLVGIGIFAVVMRRLDRGAAQLQPDAEDPDEALPFK